MVDTHQDAMGSDAADEIEGLAALIAALDAGETIRGDSPHRIAMRDVTS